MAKHIHIHLGAPVQSGKARDSAEPTKFNTGSSVGTTWYENWGGKLEKGKTYSIGGRKGKVTETSMGGTNGRTPLALVKWIDDKGKDSAPCTCKHKK